MNTKKRIARVAGVLYLLVILFGSFAELFVRSKIIVPGNAAETVQNMKASQTLFRFGFVSDLMMQLSFFFLSLALYRLLKSVHKQYADLMVGSVMVSVAIMCTNMLHHYAAMMILDGEDSLSSFNSDQLNSLVLFFLDLHKYGYRIAQLFFGLWLFPLGLLVNRSGFIPRILGALLLIAGVSFLIDFFLFFLVNDYSSSLSSLVTFPTVIGEFSFCFWLLIKGVQIRNPT